MLLYNFWQLMYYCSIINIAIAFSLVFCATTYLPIFYYIKFMYVCNVCYNTINLWKGLLIIYYKKILYNTSTPYCLPYVILMFSFTQHIGTIIMISTLVKHYIGWNNLEMKLANKLPFSLVKESSLPSCKLCLIK